MTETNNNKVKDFKLLMGYADSTKQAAKELYKLYLDFKDAGFTPIEALHLLGIILGSQLEKGRGRK